VYKREFDGLVKANKCERYVMIYGACDYQLGAMESELMELWGRDGVAKFYFDEYDFAAARAHLSQASLFGDQNTLIIKAEKGVSAKELAELVALCQKSPSNHLLFVYYGEDKRAKELVKPFGKSFVRVFKPTINEALAYLTAEAKKIGVNISGFVLQHLYVTHNENLSLAVNELAKLALLEREITSQDVDNLVFGMGEVAIDDFIARLLSGANITQLFQSLTQNGSIDEIRLMGAIQGYVYQLFLFHAYIKLNGSFDALQILGYPLPQPIAKARSEMSMRFKPATFARLMQTLTNAEYVLKTNTPIDKESYVISALLEVQEGLR
jgi:DNA polymerase-3 subunit delta